MEKFLHIKKYVLGIFITAAFCALSAITASASELPLQNLSVEYTLPNGYSYSVKAFAMDRNKSGEDVEPEGHIPDNEYTLVLPYHVEGTEVTVLMAEGDKILLGTTPLENGTKLVLEEGTYTVESGSVQYNLNVFYTSNIPQVYITIRDGAMADINADKTLKEAGSIVITDGNKVEYNGPLDYIKGRGNASWTSRKKPYSIKLGTKAKLFGMDAGKKYALIASHIETSLIRNKLAVDFADKMGIEYCTQSQHIDLYINNEYAGNYTLSEKISVGTTGVNIFDLEYINQQANRGVDFEQLTQGGNFEGRAYKEFGSYKWVNIPNDIAGGMDGGYLLEMELGVRYEDEKAGFISNYGQPVILQSPQYASQAQVEYIREFYQQMEDALLSDDGYNSLGRHYSEYMDVQSFAKMYVYQEYVQNVDAGLTSFFMYKDIGGKLTACSAWDMDHALGDDFDRNGFDLSNPYNVWAAEGYLYSAKEKTLFTLLWQHADFRRLASEEWNTVFADAIPQFADDAAQLAQSIRDSAVAEHYLWRKLLYITPQQAGEIFDDANDTLQKYIINRADFMSQHLSEDADYIIYKRNGASGLTVDRFTYMPGDTAEVKECEFVLEGANFLGWNTQPDGSGTSYMPKDIVTVNGEDVVLYAQWDVPVQQTVTVQTQPQSGFFAKLAAALKNIFRK